MINKKRYKKVLKLEELLKKYVQTKTFYQNKYSRSVAEARADEKLAKTIERKKARTSNYTLRTKILKNPWITSSPYTKALKWLHQEVFKDPKTYKYKKLLLRQGGLYTFEYRNPKYKGTARLPWFDIHPLVLSLGPVTTNEGIRNIGFNLHLLPPKIRVIVLCAVFELFKRQYRYQIYLKNKAPVSVNYQLIISKLWQFGVGFCVRMYIPRRMSQIVDFPYKDWHKAIFIPSKKYDGILASKLIQEWKKYTRSKGSSVSPNMDWKKFI